ncbi:MAG: hypothetical protein WD276_09350 [Actinomycetota bacterium]
MGETDLFKLALKGEDAATRAKLIAHFKQRETNSEFLAFYPSSSALDKAAKRVADFKCQAGPVLIWGTRGYQGDTAVNGALYCRAMVDADEFVSLMGVVRIDAEGDVASAWLGSGKNQWWQFWK